MKTLLMGILTLLKNGIKDRCFIIRANTTPTYMMIRALPLNIGVPCWSKIQQKIVVTFNGIVYSIECFLLQVFRVIKAR